MDVGDSPPYECPDDLRPNGVVGNRVGRYICLRVPSSLAEQTPSSLTPFSEHAQPFLYNGQQDHKTTRCDPSSLSPSACWSQG